MSCLSVDRLDEKLGFAFVTIFFVLALRVKIRLSKESPNQKTFRRKASSGRRKVISDDEADYDSKDDVS